MFEMLMRKGVFLYENLNSVAVLQEISRHNKNKFYSSLTS